jgi:PAS domain S-box-containing protein
MVDVTEQKRAEAALRASEARFAQAFRSNPAALAITTLHEGRFLDVNDGYLRLTGFTREEVIGKTSRELGTWTNPDERPALIERLQRNGRIVAEEMVLVTGHGPRDVLVSLERIELGGTACILGTSIDVTAQRQVAGQLARLERINRAMAEEVRLDDRLRRFYEESKVLVPCDRFVVRVLVPETDEVETLLIADFDEVRYPRARYPVHGNSPFAHLAAGAARRLSQSHPSLPLGVRGRCWPSDQRSSLQSVCDRRRVRW